LDDRNGRWRAGGTGGLERAERKEFGIFLLQGLQVKLEQPWLILADQHTKKHLAVSGIERFGWMEFPQSSYEQLSCGRWIDLVKPPGD
jgi:hypothetical protein